MVFPGEENEVASFFHFWPRWQYMAISLHPIRILVLLTKYKGFEC